MAELRDFLTAVARETKELVRREQAPILERLAQLEARLAVAESRGLKFLGVWQRAMDYRPGDTVTADGSLWVATAACQSERPGTGPAWQLAARGMRHE